MVLMGIPGIYIHSLLGSRNDYAGREKTGQARSINREKFPVAELEAELDDPGSLRARVMAGILRLLEIRQAQQAFHPNAHQVVLSVGRGVFAVLRSSRGLDGQRILALFNVSGERQSVSVGAVITGRSTDLVTGADHAAESVELGPYQICWLSF